jgi:hypothetical protein
MWTPLLLPSIGDFTALNATASRERLLRGEDFRATDTLKWPVRGKPRRIAMPGTARTGADQSVLDIRAESFRRIAGGVKRRLVCALHLARLASPETQIPTLNRRGQRQ